MWSEIGVLPPDALSGRSLAVSVSESEDLAALGLLEIHLRLALGEIARVVLFAGGNLIYGGDLREDGYTDYMLSEFERYSRRNRPLKVCLAWGSYSGMSLSALTRAQRELGLIGEIRCVSLEGEKIEFNEAVLPVEGDKTSLRRRGLTAMREYCSAYTHGRLLIGGKVSGFDGIMPGVIEEAILTLRDGKPLYLAAGFGGATYQISQALGVGPKDWIPSDEVRQHEWIAVLQDAVAEIGGAIPENGLTAEENARLATTHRASEVASLVSIGMGRLFAGQL